MSELPFRPAPPLLVQRDPALRSTIGVYADSRGLGKCRGPNCGAPIEWAQVTGSGRRLCFNRGVTRCAISYEPASRRRVDHLDRAAIHACPDAAVFRAEHKDQR